jgi:hypothetical protein
MVVLFMRQTKRILLLLFWAIWIVTGLIVLVFEFDLLQEGGCAGKTVAEYFLSVAFELATLIVIPLALSMFKWKWIVNDIRTRSDRALLFWGILRISALAVPMIACIVLYYLFMAPAFCYLAIVLGLCLFLVYPSSYQFSKDVPSSHELKEP